MPTPIIKTPQKKSGKGSFGSYYKISDDVGVKVIRNLYSKKYLHEFFEEFLDSLRNDYDDIPDIAEAAQELAVLQMLAPSGVTPKPIGLCWVDCGDGDYRIGIRMEHIEGKTMYAWNKNDADEEVHRMEGQWWRAFKNNYGIRVEDWHEWNVMVRPNGEWVRIDFSVGYFEVCHDYWREFLGRVRHEVLELMESCPA